MELLKIDFAEDIQMMFKERDYDWLLGVLARELNIEEFDGNVTHDEYLSESEQLLNNHCKLYKNHIHYFHCISSTNLCASTYLKL